MKTSYYRWLQYNIFITNVEASVLSAPEIAEAYKVRWQIEILFKSWKSGFKLQRILHHGCTNIHRVNATIYLLLMFICLVMQKVYMKYYRCIKKNMASN
jgi:IS4 transposase